jgi:hypothetical protein
MRTSWKGFLWPLTLLAVLALASLPSAFADDTSPVSPPEARIKPPGGVQSQARILPPSGGVTTQARIKPPGGEPTDDASISPPGGAAASDARIKPPTGLTAIELSWYEQLVAWLRAQARIHPPTG